MKKKIEPAELTPSEREEMIRLRAENERLKAEIAIVKKEIALREERYAAQLKAKKAAIVQELHKEGHKLNDLLDVIDLSRSTYYYELGRTDKVKERNAELSSEISTIFNENKKIRRETGTTDAKHFVTIAEMPAVRKVIESEEEDEWTAKEWAKMAAGIVCLCNSVKVLEASAEIVKNCRILDAYAEGCGGFRCMDQVYRVCQ